MAAQEVTAVLRKSFSKQVIWMIVGGVGGMMLTVAIADALS